MSVRGGAIPRRRCQLHRLTEGYEKASRVTEVMSEVARRDQMPMANARGLILGCLPSASGSDLLVCCHRSSPVSTATAAAVSNAESLPFALSAMRAAGVIPSSRSYAS